ncbi:MAG: type II secretion system GspH family protein [Verrucomicrobiae bacterium]|nr:type II secretion system GspH family protein [Verrucomicrobiae bacterium]
MNAQGTRGRPAGPKRLGLRAVGAVAELARSTVVQTLFCLVGGAILLWLGLATTAEALSGATVYNLVDPVFGFRLRYVMGMYGVLELVVGCLALLQTRTGLSLVAMAWLAANLGIYRLGLASMGWVLPYHWVAPLSGRWGISAQIADWVLVGMLSSLVVGCITLLLAQGRPRRVPAFYKMRCPDCGGKIEFPAHGVGQQVSCPHCAAVITLTAPEATGPQGPSVKPQGAFTLVELLVVISIIGILASLLMPVLTRGKDRAQRIVDINNLKQQITATHLYAADGVGYLPWPNWALGDAPDRPGWLYKLDPAATGPARFKVETGVFWPMLRNPKLYFCPRDGPHVPRFAERPQQISSYVMNGAVIGYNRTNFPPARLDAFRPDDVAFWETDEKYPDYFNDGASYPWEGVSARHDLGAIHAAFGGQVGFIKLELWYLEEAKPTRNRLWCYPGSEDGR